MRNVIFDMGGVVLDWNPLAILESLYEQPADRLALKSALFDHPDWLELDRGTLDEVQLLERAAARLPAGLVPLEGFFEALRGSLKPKAATLALIERLVQRGVPLYCLSNMPVSIYDHLRAEHAFWTVFRGVVISGEVRMIKPEREIFEHLLTRHGLEAERSVFIDDLPRNVEAAREVGLHAILFRDAQQCERELLPLLD
jgi:putative hydrolase of the HAD superfamily